MKTALRPSKTDELSELWGPNSILATFPSRTSASPPAAPTSLPKACPLAQPGSAPGPGKGGQVGVAGLPSWGRSGVGMASDDPGSWLHVNYAVEWAVTALSLTGGVVCWVLPWQRLPTERFLPIVFGGIGLLSVSVVATGGVHSHPDAIGGRRGRRLYFPHRDSLRGTGFGYDNRSHRGAKVPLAE